MSWWSELPSVHTENLVPNIFLELFFMVQLLTSRSAATTEEEEQSVCVVKPG